MSFSKPLYLVALSLGLTLAGCVARAPLEAR